MTPSLIAIAFVIAGWSIFAKGLQRWHLTAPIVLVLAGVAVGLTTRSALASTLNTEVAQRVAEFILATGSPAIARLYPQPEKQATESQSAR